MLINYDLKFAEENKESVPSRTKKYMKRSQDPENKEFNHDGNLYRH